jgi:drug/metabolite transporter (DMT)-like permease
VSGVLWGAASGLGFGLFQAVNVRAVRKLDDVYFSTFLQLVVAALVCALISLGTGDLSRLGEANAWALTSFTIAGALHFFLGWTFLNVSQHRIGAARSAPLLATVPLWGIAIAAVVFGQLPNPEAIAGIAVMVVGALTVTSPASLEGLRWQDSLFALGTAFLWALSPIFTIEGLDELDSPLLGVTIGVVSSALAFGILLLASPGSRAKARGLPRAGIALKMLSGAIVALATWGRFEALDTTPVGVVLALNLLSVPSVLILAPLMAGRHAERVTVRVWVGAALVIAGSLLLIALD